MSDKSTEKPQGTQPTPTAATQQLQPVSYKPNPNIQPPQYQIVTEGYDPRTDISHKPKLKKHPL